ncbi:FadR/GntR family transcriptional regulator [Microbacterium sp. SORGH_AS_0888]|uniref:FadR/GntR family transcriptional regulator n=1 Tax=Microbacterium sp. SORGH_AS_0888 TaxID=3041791 RepID=UPI00277F533D|nr:FadR/GntR family transcriptional regulator [Microbacterium sp. SORGH_AS_0888]MDQ1130293.1 GntR family galactonate operon transcriptional repressor [Microbacterium sp. SORGH_AS_0888]
MSRPRLTDAGGGIFAQGAARTPVARLGVVVVHDLVTAIVTGEIAEGSMLPIESELSTHFGVSRTVIRESIKRIEEKGLVAVVQGSGTTVRTRESWNVLDPVVLQVMLENDASLGVLDDLAVVRSALEGAMAAATAARRSDGELDRLRAAYDHMVETIDREDEYNDADMLFHLAVMEQSHIPLAESITRTLYSRARESARFTTNPSPDVFQQTLDEHRRILEAIAAQDPGAAEAAMRTHIMDAWQRRRQPTARKP